MLPALRAHRPELILISAGFDAHRDDPLANLELVEDDYRWITTELTRLAGEMCDGPRGLDPRRRLQPCALSAPAPPLTSRR